MSNTEQAGAAKGGAHNNDRSDLAGQSQATKVQAVPDLHNAIMNLPCSVPKAFISDLQARVAFKEGHRDARHAAAALVNEAVAAQEVTQQAAKAETAEHENEQVSGIAYPTTHADLARISHNTLFTRWVGDRSEAAISPREAFIAARQLPRTPTTSTVSAPDAIRNAVLEEAAQACEVRGNEIVQKWTNVAGTEENARSIIDDAKARAWDALQCAAAIRALRTVSTAGAQNAEAIRNQAYAKCIEIAESELSNTNVLTSMPPQSAAAFSIANRIRFLQSGTAFTKTGENNG